MNRGASALVIGSTTMLARRPGVQLRVKLLDVAKQAQLAAYTETVPAEQLRAAAHRIADMIYEKLTGDVGVFSTRIAYVVKQGKKFSLQVADADGYNSQPVIEYTEPIISPAWSPDGTRLAYVSFENKKPVVYVQTLATRARKAAANFRGSNSAPAWSPDGKKLAVVLSLMGGSQIFLVNCGWQWRVAKNQSEFGNRYGAKFFSRRPLYHFYLGSRRQPADLSYGGNRKPIHDQRSASLLKEVIMSVPITVRMAKASPSSIGMETGSMLPHRISPRARSNY